MWARCANASPNLHAWTDDSNGKNAKLAVGNVLPVGKCPEGTVVSMVEDKYGDRGTVAKASGTSCIVVGRFFGWGRF